MLTKYDFTLTKSSNCTITLDNVIDIDFSTGVGTNEITYSLNIPEAHTNDINSITQIDVTKGNSCCSSDEETAFSIITVLEEAGDLSFDSEQDPEDPTNYYEFVEYNTPLDMDKVTKFVWTQKRSGVTVRTFTDLDPENYGKFLGANGANLLVTSDFLVSDVIELEITYTNGVTQTVIFSITGGATSNQIGNASAITSSYTSMVVDSSNVYVIDQATGNITLNDESTFATKDGIWFVKLKVYYKDINNNDRTVTTTKCVYVDCNDKCEYPDEIIELLENKDYKDAALLGVLQESIDFATDCDKCCTACRLFEYLKKKSASEQICNDCS